MRISVAIPESSLSDESLKSAKTRKASVIARSCAIFGVDTIYVYGEGRYTQDRNSRGFDGYNSNSRGGHNTHRPSSSSSSFSHTNRRSKGKPNKTSTSVLRHDADLLIMALRYVETPQFLRKRLFPHLNDLKFAGMMLPLRIPSHTVTKHPEKGQTREGVVVPAKGGRFIDIGAEKLLRYTGRVEPGRRITIAIKNTNPNITYVEIDKSDTHQYWGYHVRHRASLPSLLSEWRNAKGQTIITSRRGKPAKGMNQSNRRGDEIGRDNNPHAHTNADMHHTNTADCNDHKNSRALNTIKDRDIFEKTTTTANDTFSTNSRILRNMSDMLVVFGSPERGVHEILGGNVSAISDARVLNFFPDQQTATVRLEEAITGTLAVINAEIHMHGISSTR